MPTSLITVDYDAVEYDPVMWNDDVERTVVHLDSVPRRHRQQLSADARAARQRCGHPHGVDRQTWPGPLSPTTIRPKSTAERRTLTALDVAASRRATRWTETQSGRRVLDGCARNSTTRQPSPATSAPSISIWPATSGSTSPGGCCSPTANKPWGRPPRRRLAACLVRPDGVVSVSGDGGFLFSAQELETAARLGLTFTHIILPR